MRLYKFDLLASVRKKNSANKNKYSKTQDNILINNYLKTNIQKYELRSIEYNLGIPNRIPNKEIKSFNSFDDEIEKWEQKYLDITKNNQSESSQLLIDSTNFKNYLEQQLEELDIQIRKSEHRDSDRIETNFNGTNNQRNQLNKMRASVLRSMNEMRDLGASSKSGM